MLTNPIPDDLVSRFRRLAQADQRRALAYVEKVDVAASGSALLPHVNLIPAEDLEEMVRAIDADCEGVDAEAW